MTRAIWRPISTTDAPGPRSDHAAAWLGTKMIIWGSSDGLTDGYLYDPGTFTETSGAIWTPE